MQHFFLIKLIIFTAFATACISISASELKAAKPAENEPLPYDFQLSNFKERKSDDDDFYWSATLTNLGPGTAKIPWGLQFYESTSEHFDTGHIVSTKIITRVDGKPKEPLLPGESVEITDSENNHAAGLVGDFLHTPTYAKIEISSDSGPNMLLGPQTTKRPESLPGWRETNYANNVSNTIKVEREKYREKPLCVEQDQEENDSVATAQPINIGVKYDLSLCLDDRDIFSLNLTGGLKYNLRYSGPAGVSRFVLYSPDYELVFDKGLITHYPEKNFNFRAPVSGKYYLVFARTLQTPRHVRVKLSFEVNPVFK